MNFNEVNKFLNYCISNAYIRLLHRKIEKCNCTSSDYYTLAALSIASTLFVLFCKFRHRWLMNVQYLIFCNYITKIWRGKRYWWSCNYSQGIDEYPQNSSIQDHSLSLLIGKTEENDVSNKLQETYNKNEKSPVNKYKKNNHISYSGNAFNTSSIDICNLTKVVHKKLIRDDLSMRFQLLDAEKKLCTKMKQVKELEKELRDIKENAVRDRSHYQGKPLNGSSSLAIRKRTSFFTSTVDCSIRDSNFRRKDESEIMDTANIQLTNSTEQINQLKEMHLYEVTSLQESISQKEETISKLIEINNKSIEIYKQVQQENEWLKHEGADTFIKLRELTLMKERNEQASKNISECEANLSKELQRIRKLKSLLVQEFKPSFDMPMIAEENEWEESLSSWQYQMSIFNEDLDRYKEENARLARRDSTPSPRAPSDHPRPAPAAVPPNDDKDNSTRSRSPRPCAAEPRVDCCSSPDEEEIADRQAARQLVQRSLRFEAVARRARIVKPIGSGQRPVGRSAAPAAPLPQPQPSAELENQGI